ncbi:MAG: hypothetical protein NTZ18_04980 [Candidatus Komeilibacteria bacterium]|nr:hypothetical protein [Candidatus Komeilibacteria bacterium]
MTIHVKKQLIDSIKGILLDPEEQIQECHKTKGGASVAELIECWFDYMPRVLFSLLDGKIINDKEQSLLAEFHGYIDCLSLFILKEPNGNLRSYKDEDIFRSDSNWAKLREKAKEIYKKLQEVKS